MSERTVGIVCDYEDEEWPSMDLAAELLELALREHTGGRFRPVLLRPAMPRIARRILPNSEVARNADRYAGRYLAYPRWLKKRARELDLYHVVDHSYAHLAHHLPRGRAVVTCHDLDAFRSLREPEAEPRPAWFRGTMARVYSGLRRAARVTTDAEPVRLQLVEDGFDGNRVVTIPLPVHPDFGARADHAADAEAARHLGPPTDAPELLHVGSTVARKRIDLLLRVFAGVRARHPSARLVRAGGPLTDAQRALAAELGVAEAIAEVPFVTRPVLAALYRRAAVVLAPSEREGFGLPLVEAMACGTPVIASDLAVFGEVGGEVVVYRRLDDEEGWVDAVDTVLWERRDPHERLGRRAAALERAAEFGVDRYAARLAEVYDAVLGTR